jgi:hypothetical protein
MIIGVDNEDWKSLQSRWRLLGVDYNVSRTLLMKEKTMVKKIILEKSHIT